MVQWLIPVAWIMLGLLAGVIFERILFKRLEKFAKIRDFPGNKIFFQSLDRITFIFFTAVGFYGAIISYPLNPNTDSVVKRFLTVILLYAVTVFFARLTAGFVTAYGQRTSVISVSLVSNLTKITVLILGTLITLQTVGIQITPVLTTLGIGGLAVALALQDTLSNLFSGVYLILSQQIRTGDYLKLESNQEGYVTDINWRYTTIKEINENIVIVPNSKLASAIFTNYHLPVKQAIIPIQVGVSFDSDLEQVEKVTVEVAQEVIQEISGDIPGFEPHIRYHTFGDFRIQFTVYIAVKEFGEERLAKHEFLKRLRRRYREEGIEIPVKLSD